MRTFLIALVLTSCFASEVRAFSTYGTGGDLCHNFTDDSKNIDTGVKPTTEVNGVEYSAPNAVDIEWMHGFITAMNAVRPDKDIQIDEASLDLWLRNWCRDHPMELFSHAAEAFILDRYGVSK